MTAIEEHGRAVGLKPLCAALGVSRETYYRRRRPPKPRPERERPPPARALAETEKQAVLDELHSERFSDRAPFEVYGTLLDEGRYLCSPRTMYRILAENRELRERRNQLRHPEYKKPELLATAPNQVWTWDITKLLGPTKWSYFYLYVILDIFSRYVVGWMLAHSESAELARRLIRETCEKHGINPDELTIHSDRGPAMTSKLVSQLLADLCVAQSFNRPHVSNDNPFVESHFKTLKYGPGFPDRFDGGFQHAHAHCNAFFPWYNTEHCHSSLAALTPAQVHFGQAPRILEQREQVVRAAYERHPERFVRGLPSIARPPQAVDQPAADGRRGDRDATAPSERHRGLRDDHHHPTWLTSFMTPGVSCALTSSGTPSVKSAVGKAQQTRASAVSEWSPAEAERTVKSARPAFGGCNVS